MHTADYWIKRLDLIPHPEGGFYREIYRSAGIIPANALPPAFDGERAYSTAIYFLLPGGTFSAFHRIEQDELWHFYDGCTIILHCISPDGIYSSYNVGIEENAEPQLVIPAGTWFAAEPQRIDSFSLAGCTVAPGFDFHDFKMPSREELIAQFPTHEKIIYRLTYPAVQDEYADMKIL